MFCEIAFDCDTLQGLCPGQEYQISCSVYTEYVYQKITISDGSCVKKAIELDFTPADTQFENTQDPKCGEFNATSTIQNRWKKIDMSFGATESINRATATCLGQASQGQVIDQSCLITLKGKQCQCRWSIIMIVILFSSKDNPDPPNSLSISTTLPVTMSWSRPQNTREDLSLNYIVVVSSSLGRNETLKLNETSILLDEDNTINVNITYSVCVSAQNCVGESAPVCMERIVYGKSCHCMECELKLIWSN